MNQDTFTFDEGQVVLQWPASISPESYEDLKDWLDLMARRMKRAIATDLDKTDKWESLKDVEYRREYSADIGTGLAFQIKLLREKNGWTQDRLAELTGKQQETISQWENPDYGNYTLNTLKSLASAFDVALIVKFAPFSELAKWMSALTPERLAPPSFKEEAQAIGRPAK